MSAHADLRCTITSAECLLNEISTRALDLEDVTIEAQRFESLATLIKLHAERVQRIQRTAKEAERADAPA